MIIKLEKQETIPNVQGEIPWKALFRRWDDNELNLRKMHCGDIDGIELVSNMGEFVFEVLSLQITKGYKL
jgi:hypothetical protein